MVGLRVWGRLGDDPFPKLLLVAGEHHLLDHPLVLLDLRLLVPQQFLLRREPVLKVVHRVAPVHPRLGAKSAPDLWDYFFYFYFYLQVKLCGLESTING